MTRLRKDAQSSEYRATKLGAAGNRRRPATLLRFLICVLALLVALGAAPARAQETPAGAGTLEECSTVDEATLLDELNRVTQAVFADALTRIDVQRIVDDQWAELGLDAVVRVEVDRAVERVQSDTDLWSTMLSGWSADKARELSLAVASRAFDSEAFRKAIDDLSLAVATQIAAEMNTISAEGSSAALYCLQTFIKGNYAGVLLAAFEDEVADVTGAVGPGSESLAPGLLGIIEQHKVALGGIGVIIAAQITRRIVNRIAQNLARRVAGRVTSRVLGRLGSTVIPLAGWIIGGGMLLYDVWDSADGALPQIQESFQSAEMMEAIRSEIAEAIPPELELEIPEVAREIANDLYSQWLAVKRDIRVILDLAGQNETFAGLLAGIEEPEQLSRLVSVSGALLTSGDRARVIAAAESGTLQRAVELAADVTPIVQATGSLDAALAWNEAAGELLDDVVRLEIYKHSQPGQLDRATLQRLIAVQDPAAVARLALLPVDQLTTLLALSNDSVRELARSLTPEQLGWLAATLTGLDDAGRNALVSQLVSDPTVMLQLQQTDLLDVMPPGADLGKAIDFMAGSNDALGVVNDTFEVMTDAPTVGMFRAKHGWGVTLLAFAALLLVALIAVRLIWALFAWVLEPIFAIGRLGRRRGSPPAYPPEPPPAPRPRQSVTYGPTPTNAPPDARRAAREPEDGEP